MIAQLEHGQRGQGFRRVGCLLAQPQGARVFNDLLNLGVVLDVDEVTDAPVDVVESPTESPVGAAVAHAASSNIRAASRVIDVMMTTP